MGSIWSIYTTQYHRSAAQHAHDSKAIGVQVLTLDDSAVAGSSRSSSSTG
jgi:hypothetical protein